MGGKEYAGGTVDNYEQVDWGSGEQMETWNK